MVAIRQCEITGYGTYLAENVVTFDDQTRYRVGEETSQLDMLQHASELAIEKAGIELEDIDCIIAASAVGVQPIPSTASLLMERVAPEAPAAALDINSTCTSFLTAVDTASYFIDAGRYKNVLIASGDMASRSLNPNQQESYELFSDATAAIVLSGTDDPGRGVIASKQRTWPKHAHDTEIRGGLTAFPPQHHATHPEEYLFDMQGRKALLGILHVLPAMFTQFYAESGLTTDDFKLVIPHQASRALPLAMSKLNIPEDKYVNIVQDYGNMVSASVPYALCMKLEDGSLQHGDKALLCGTAAGLTANILAMAL